MYGGKIRLENPMLFCLGFLFQFLIAGLTGVMLAVAPLNLATDGLLLCRGALSLHAGRQLPVRHIRRHLLLVSKGDWKKG